MFSTLTPRVFASITILALAQMCGSSADAEDAAKPGANASSQYSRVVFTAVDKDHKKLSTSISGRRVSLVVPANFGVAKRVTGVIKLTQKKYEMLTLSSPAPAGAAPPQIVILVTQGLSFETNAMGGNLTALIASYMLTPTKLADACLREYPKMFTDFKKSTSSTADLNGTKFGTATFEGRRQILGPNLVHGFTYVAMIQNCTVIVEGLDPGAKPDSLPALNKAARSVRVD